MTRITIAARAAWRITRLAVRSAMYLITIRRAFPWPLRVLLVIAMVQTPLPIDEVAAVIAAAWIARRYRPTLRVAIRAAQMDQS